MLKFAVWWGMTPEDGNDKECPMTWMRVGIELGCSLTSVRSELTRWNRPCEDFVVVSVAVVVELGMMQCLQILSHHYYVHHDHFSHGSSTAHDDDGSNCY